MKLKIKYRDKDYPRLQKIARGDWIDLRVNGIRNHCYWGLERPPRQYHFDKMDYIRGDIIRFGLGIAMELPEGYEAEIRSRSSTLEQYGLILTNGVGTIDNSYKGDGDEWQAEYVAIRAGTIHRHDRICQFRIWENQPEFELVEVESLGNVDRKGRKGYGTTGYD